MRYDVYSSSIYTNKMFVNLGVKFFEFFNGVFFPFLIIIIIIIIISQHQFCRKHPIPQSCILIWEEIGHQKVYCIQQLEAC